MISTTEIQNIIPYISFNTLKQLVLINKKYKESVEEIKVIPSFEYFERHKINEEEYNKKKNKLFSLFKFFPNAVAASIKADDMTQINPRGKLEWEDFENLSKLKQIRIINLPDDIDVLDVIRKKIVVIESKIYYYDEIDFDSFPLLNKLILNFDGNAFDFKHFFENRVVNIEIVVIKGFYNYELLIEILRKGNIGNKIIVEVNDEINENEVEELSKYCTVTMRNCNEITNNKVIVLNGKYYDDWENEFNLFSYENDDLMYLMGKEECIDFGSINFESISLNK